MLGGVEILARNFQKISCIPLILTIQDGLKPVFELQKDEIRLSSHLVQTIHNAHKVVKQVGPAILLLDRYYLAVPAIQTLNQLNYTHQTTLHLVTKDKHSCKAYEKPNQSINGRDHPRKRENLLN